MSEFDPKSYETLEKVHSGYPGSIYKVREVATGCFCALKVTELLGEDELMKDMEEALMEMKVLIKYDNRFIIKYLHAYRQGNDKGFVVMELCELGSIISCFPKLKIKGLPEPAVAYIIHCVLHGLNYVHKQDKIHRAIRGKNVLVNNRGEIKLKMNDGFSSVNRFYLLSKTSDSAFWMAPETTVSDSYDKMVDIWAIGITAIELTDGVPPNSNMNWQDVGKLLRKPTTPPPSLSNPAASSPDFLDFLSLCLKRNPKERADIPALLSHPFLASKYAPLGAHHLLPIVQPLIEK